MNDKVNGGTFNVVYLREYIDPECESEILKLFTEMLTNKYFQNLIMKK